MVKYFVFLSILLGVPSSAFADKGILVRAYGMAPCSFVLQQNWWDDKKEPTPIASYILGYLSGVPNVKEESNKEVVRLVRKECESNPSQVFYTALKEVAHRLQSAPDEGKTPSDQQKPDQQKDRPLIPPEQQKEEYSHRPLKPGEEKF